jgi:hypothetical protein
VSASPFGREEMSGTVNKSLQDLMIGILGLKTQMIAQGILSWRWDINETGLVNVCFDTETHMRKNKYRISFTRLPPQKGNSEQKKPVQVFFALHSLRCASE